VQPFIRKFKKGRGLDKLWVKGLEHEANRDAFANGLVREGGVFIEITQSGHPRKVLR